MTQEAKAKFDPVLALEFYQKGMTDRQIADALGVKPGLVRHWRNRAGLVVNRVPWRPVSRLDVDGKGRALYESGATDKEIAAAFNMTPNGVQQWRARRGLLPNKNGTVSGFAPAPKGPAKMFMTDDEIRDSWRRAASWREQVKILAELNACSVEQMQEKLVELGCLVEVSS